jgi:hypothetical protein
MPKTYIVEQGDDFITIAGKFGFHSAAKIEAANPDLGRKAHLLYPGDVVTIPDVKPVAMSAKEKSRTKFKLTQPRRTIQLVQRNWAGEPIVDKKYQVFARDEYRAATTGADGLVTAEFSWRDRHATLVIDGQACKLLLGHLNPTENVADGAASGVAQRLALLGYAPGALDGTDREALSDAIRRYENDRDLEVVGEITPELLETIEGEVA